MATPLSHMSKIPSWISLIGHSCSSQQLRFRVPGSSTQYQPVGRVKFPTSRCLLTELAVLYLPEWMPGAAFKKTAKKWKATLKETVEIPMRFVKKQMAEKHFEPSHVSALYEKAGAKISKQEEDSVKFTAFSLYAGGADTVSSSLVLSDAGGGVWASFPNCNHRRP